MKRLDLLTEELGRVVHEDIFAKYCGYVAGLDAKSVVYRAERAILRSLKDILGGANGANLKDRKVSSLVSIVSACERSLEPGGKVSRQRQSLYAQSIQGANFAKQNGRDSDALVYEVMAHAMSHPPEHDGAFSKLLGMLRLTRRASNSDNGLAVALHMLCAVYLDRQGDEHGAMAAIAMLYTRVASEAVGMELLTC
jgi:hypothetical protein